jgi:hypothetical protein
MRIASEDRAVAQYHRDGSFAVQRQRGAKLFEMNRLDTSNGEADDAAVPADDPARKDHRPVSGDLAFDGLDQRFRHRFAGCEFLEIEPVGNIDRGKRPFLGRVHHLSVGSEQVQRSDMRKCPHFRTQHLMSLVCGHALPEGFWCVHAFLARIVLHLAVNALQDGQLLVEMPREHLGGVGELVLGGFHRAVA